MGWIKRNLFFFIGLVLAVLLLGAAGFYDFKSYQHNQDALARLTDIYNTIQQDNHQKPSPGNDQVDNVQIAKDQQQQLQVWLKRAQDSFQPIQPIPNPANGPVTSELFAPALSKTVKQLQREANGASVQLPPGDFFSFTAQSDKAVFDSVSLGDIAQQLGDVKAIVEILFSARINELESIQRVPVSRDDTSGTGADYITDQPNTNNLAVMMPYQVTFRGFSSDIANVLTAFASSPNGFVVRTISVLPATATETAANNQGGPSPALLNNASMPTTMPGRGGLQTILNEQMLRVTLEIEVIRLTPNS